MLRWTMSTVCVVLLCANLTWAADKATKAPAKPIGTWTKTEGEITITFQIKADDLQVILKMGEDRAMTVTADYGISKDGHLFARISKVSLKGVDNGPGEGEMFSFRFKLDKNKLTMSDLVHKEANEDAKRFVEGDYEKGK